MPFESGNDLFPKKRNDVSERNRLKKKEGVATAVWIRFSDNESLKTFKKLSKGRTFSEADIRAMIEAIT